MHLLFFDQEYESGHYVQSSTGYAIYWRRPTVDQVAWDVHILRFVREYLPSLRTIVDVGT